MNPEQLARERDADLELAQRITDVIEPLVNWRDTLLRRAGARNELLRQEVPPQVMEDALRRARNMLAHGLVPSAAGVVDDLGPRGAAGLIVSAPQYSNEARSRYVPAPGVELATEAGAVIEDILEAAGRPLHREEIYQRSKLHEFGPVNRSTLVTRLSRDERFQNMRRPGYWLLRDWPAEKKRAQIVAAGRIYADALSKLERDFPMLVSMARDIDNLSASARRSRAQRTSETDPDRQAVIERDLEVNMQVLSRLTFDMRRAFRRVEAERERATAARQQLGPEAEYYPGLPPLPYLEGGDANRVQFSHSLPLFDGNDQSEGDDS